MVNFFRTYKTHSLSYLDITPLIEVREKCILCCSASLYPCFEIQTHHGPVAFQLRRASPCASSFIVAIILSQQTIISGRERCGGSEVCGERCQPTKAMATDVTKAAKKRKLRRAACAGVRYDCSPHASICTVFPSIQGSLLPGTHCTCCLRVIYAGGIDPGTVTRMTTVCFTNKSRLIYSRRKNDFEGLRRDPAGTDLARTSTSVFGRAFCVDYIAFAQKCSYEEIRWGKNTKKSQP